MNLENYAGDQDVRFIQNGRAGPAPDWVYTCEDAGANCGDEAKEISLLIQFIARERGVGNIVTFAVAFLGTPFRVFKIQQNRFVILVDLARLRELRFFCLRIQMLPPIADFLGACPVAVAGDQSDQSLLDIIGNLFKTVGETLQPEDICPTPVVATNAVAFALAHEIAHIAHGHADFLSSPDRLAFSTDEADFSLTKRALEMDADSSATTFVYALNESAITAQRQSLTGAARAGFNDLERKSRAAYILAIYAAHLYADFLMGNRDPSNHPIGYARFLTASGLLKICLSKEVSASAGVEPENVRHLLVQTFVSLNGSLEALRHPMASNVVVYAPDGGVAHIHSEIGAAVAQSIHLEPLYRRWSRLHPVLSKYQRGGKLAPATAIPN